MSPGAILVLTGKEVTDARRNRWFLIFAVLFAGLSLGLSWFGLSGLGSLGISGFARTTASLLNLVVLIVPLMGLIMGSVALAAEREQGTLRTLLCQPIGRLDLLLGKYIGLAIALTGAILLGFGLTGLVIAEHAGGEAIGDYLTLAGLTVLLGLASLSIGMFVSALVRRTVTAVGAAIFLWLVLVLGSDLGVMGTAIAFELPAGSILWATIVNPAQAFKLAVLQSIFGNLENLGPAGLHARDALGERVLPALVGVLVAWIVAPLGLTAIVFGRRSAL